MYATVTSDTFLAIVVVLYFEYLFPLIAYLIAVIYMYIGYINGLFQKRFYPDDIKLPMLLIGGSDIVYNLVVYLVMFLFRSRFAIADYFTSIILPEFVYTMVITIFLYYLLLKINQKLEAYEKRSAKKFEL